MAQNASEPVELRAELIELRAEIAELRSRVQQLEGKPNRIVDPASGAEPARSAQPIDQPPAAVTPEAFSTLQAQVSGLAQTKVESNSRQPVKIFGTIVSSTVR